MLTSISISHVFVLDQDEALDFYVGKLGLEVSNDLDLGFMRWLTVRVPGHPDRDILLERPGPPAMDEASAGQVRELITKGASGFTVGFTTPDCSGNDAFVTITPQLTKRQAVILPKGIYPTWNATEAWLFVSDPFPTPTTGTIATVFHSQWDNGACSPYPAPGFTYSGMIFGGVWMLLNRTGLVGR